ncbi:MAG: TatD family hydrolase [Epsilonproteobacteria bacterium]|nr:TatD family hydrolase [Campylobacterota bacterium]
MIIDTHVHLDDNRYKDDLDEVLKRAKDAGVVKYIIPGADPTTLPRAIELSEKYEDIYFAVGVHPYDKDRYDRELLEKYITHPKCVAVGECGLDYYRLPKDKKEADKEKEEQKEIFIDQIELANRYKKPLIVHIREASLDSKNILEQYSKYGGVLHCFNASEILIDLAKKGFYFGIGGVITFLNAKKLVRVYPKLPIDRLLIETDGPYLTPHPYRGKRNEPAYCRLILKKMSELSQIEEEKLEDIILENTHRLFSF